MADTLLGSTNFRPQILEEGKRCLSEHVQTSLTTQPNDYSRRPVSSISVTWGWPTDYRKMRTNYLHIICHLIAGAEHPLAELESMVLVPGTSAPGTPRADSVEVLPFSRTMRFFIGCIVHPLRSTQVLDLGCEADLSFYAMET